VATPAPIFHAYYTSEAALISLWSAVVRSRRSALGVRRLAWAFKRLRDLQPTVSGPRRAAPTSVSETPLVVPARTRATTSSRRRGIDSPASPTLHDPAQPHACIFGSSSSSSREVALLATSYLGAAPASFSVRASSRRRSPGACAPILASAWHLRNPRPARFFPARTRTGYWSCLALAPAGVEVGDCSGRTVPPHRLRAVTACLPRSCLSSASRLAGLSTYTLHALHKNTKSTVGPASYTIPLFDNYVGNRMAQVHFERRRSERVGQLRAHRAPFRGSQRMGLGVPVVVRRNLDATPLDRQRQLAARPRGIKPTRPFLHRPSLAGAQSGAFAAVR